MIGLTALVELRADFSGWRIWWDEGSGQHHAIRKVESFTQSAASARRFHVAARTPDELSALLFAQAIADYDEITANLDRREAPPG